MKVWCLFEESSHDDIYERDCDGRYLMGVYAKFEDAKKAMEEASRHVGVAEHDSIDETDQFKISISKWYKVNHCGKDEYWHDCDWVWSIEEMEVIE